MEQSLLQKLPREIRDDIYERTLFVPGIIGIDCRKEAPRGIGYLTKHRVLALTITCKQIGDESRPIFYSTNYFHVRTNAFGCVEPCVLSYHTAWSLNLVRWFHQIGISNTMALRRLNIDLGGRMCNEWEEPEFQFSIEEHAATLVHALRDTAIRCTISMHTGYMYLDPFHPCTDSKLDIVYYDEIDPRDPEPGLEQSMKSKRNALVRGLTAKQKRSWQGCSLIEEVDQLSFHAQSILASIKITIEIKSERAKSAASEMQ